VRRKTLGYIILIAVTLTGTTFGQDRFAPGVASIRDLTIPNLGLLYDFGDLTNFFSDANGKEAGSAATGGTVDATTPRHDDSVPATTAGTSAAMASDAPTSEQSAAVPAAPGSPQAKKDDPNSHWHFVLAPYLWFPGAHGDLGALGRNVGFKASPTDLLSHFRFGLMGAVEARYQRLLVTVDLMYMRLSADKARPLENLGGVISANITANTVIVTPKVGLRLINTEKIKIDALAGVRYWNFSENLSFSPSILGLNYSPSQSWLDPLVGGRMQMALSPKLMFTGSGDTGGWGAGAQQEYQIAGVLGYKIKPNMALQAGYRYLYVNYMTPGNVGAVVKTALSGVIFGVAYELGPPR
jgi:hypothetical protein